jgi:ElaB/YqjD/DUF883 family membrane-anchored ribosome-binding protein
MVESEWGIARAYPSSSPRERLVAQLRALAYDAEVLLRAAAGSTGDAAAAARARTEAALRTAREDALAAADLLARGARAGAHSTASYVRQNPMQAVGIAFGAGLLLGLISRRR